MFMKEFALAVTIVGSLIYFNPANAGEQPVTIDGIEMCIDGTAKCKAGLRKNSFDALRLKLPSAPIDTSPYSTADEIGDLQDRIEELERQLNK